MIKDDTLINQAAEKYKKALQLNPKNTAANIRLGIIYLSGTKPNLEKTMAILDKVDTGTKLENVATPLEISVATAKIETLSYLGISYRLAGNQEKAVQAYEKALDLHSNMAIQYETTYKEGFYQVVWSIKFELADLYCRQNKLKAAFDLLNNLVLLDNIDSRWEAIESLGGDNANLNYVIGCVYSSNEKYDLAMKKIEKAIGLDKTNAKYYNALGCMYFVAIYADMSPEVKEFYTVKGYFEKALELNPNYSVACGNMSRVLNEIKIYEDRMDDEALKTQIKAYAEKADAGNSNGELELSIYRSY